MFMDNYYFIFKNTEGCYHKLCDIFSYYFEFTFQYSLSLVTGFALKKAGFI